MGNKRWKVASFFSGIGGLDAPFTWLDFDITSTCEIDAFNQQILKQHYPGARHYADITKVTTEQIGAADVIIGGFPCQDISVAGKRAGLSGSRSGLYWHLHRLIRQVRPRIVVLENVGAIYAPTGNDDSPGSIVTSSLAALGYDAAWLPVRASDVGAPHRRERWFCVAYTNRCRLERRHVKRTGDGEARRARGVARHYQARPGYYRARRTQSRMGRVAHGAAYWLDKARNRDAHAQQWPAPQGDYQHPYEPPRTTQDKMYRRARVKALGNAVVPQQALPIALAVRLMLDKWRN